MKADALNPRQLFDGNVHYEIPAFQRPYVWNEENQWAPLWGDVVRVAEKVVEAGEGAGGVPAGHFLGAVVYESKPPVVGDVTRHLVIDGQQRTTTLQVLIDAVQHVVQERGHELMAEDLEGLVLNRSAVFKGKPERFKLWPSKGDRQAFSQAMDPHPGWEGEHRIILAHDFFRAEASAWLSGQADADGISPPGSEEQRVLALSSTLQHRLYLVAINLTGHDDSQLIFETLNDRGTPLLKADLIKNWIFQRAIRPGRTSIAGPIPTGPASMTTGGETRSRKVATPVLASTSSSSTGSQCACGRRSSPSTSSVSSRSTRCRTSRRRTSARRS